MSKLISKCCGAEVDLAEEDCCGDGCIVIKIPYYECSKCGKPTEVEEKDHDEEWKPVRDAYSGERKEE